MVAMNCRHENLTENNVCADCGDPFPLGSYLPTREMLKPEYRDIDSADTENAPTIDRLGRCIHINRERRQPGA